MLLCVTAAVLALMPFTEACLAADNFPRGGEDFELSVFLVLALLCMALLALFLDRGWAQELLTEPPSEPQDFAGVPSVIASASVHAVMVWNPPRSRITLGAFSVPRRI